MAWMNCSIPPLGTVPRCRTCQDAPLQYLRLASQSYVVPSTPAASDKKEGTCGGMLFAVRARTPRHRRFDAPVVKKPFRAADLPAAISEAARRPSFHGECTTIARRNVSAGPRPRGSGRFRRSARRRAIWPLQRRHVARARSGIRSRPGAAASLDNKHSL